MFGHDILPALGGVAGTMNFLWGGFLSCLSEFSVFTSLLALYRRGTCHEPVRIPLTRWHTRCWRHGHHQVEGTPYKACRKHHPDLPDKAQPGEIARAYEEAKSADHAGT